MPYFGTHDFERLRNAYVAARNNLNQLNEMRAALVTQQAVYESSLSYLITLHAEFSAAMFEVTEAAPPQTGIVASTQRAIRLNEEHPPEIDPEIPF